MWRPVDDGFIELTDAEVKQYKMLGVRIARHLGVDMDDRDVRHIMLTHLKGLLRRRLAKEGTRSGNQGRHASKVTAGDLGIRVGFRLMLTLAPKSVIDAEAIRGFTMTKDEIIELLQSVLPHMTSRRIARLTGKSQRVVQKWLSGEDAITLGSFGIAMEQRKALKDTDFAARLHALIEECKDGGGGQAGLHSEVIGSHLAAEYTRVTGIPLE